MTDDEQPLYHPGSKCPRSGQWAVLDEDGNLTGNEITLSRGEHFPPTEVKGYTFRLSDATHHASHADAHGDE